MPYRAVLFDLGGVVLGSPMAAIAHFERDRGIPAGWINRHIATSAPDGAWQKLERGALRVPAWSAAFSRECSEAGQALDAAALMAAIRAATDLRPRMQRAIAEIRRQGLVAAALTNNWHDDGTEALRPLFDLFLESSKLGLRKPDPKIYQVACRQIGAQPGEIVYLDDIGYNLKPARAMGMTTLKVQDADETLDALQELLGFALR